MPHRHRPEALVENAALLIQRKACLEYAPEVGLGHWVVIHVGFAISVVDEEEAARSYALLQEMDNLENIDLPQDPDGVRPEAIA